RVASRRVPWRGPPIRARGDRPARRRDGIPHGLSPRACRPAYAEGRTDPPGQRMFDDPGDIDRNGIPDSIQRDPVGVPEDPQPLIEYAPAPGPAGFDPPGAAT